MNESTVKTQSNGRLLSLDAMRGAIMILLCAESCLLYVALKDLNMTAPFSTLVEQFFHHPWHGLRFWDLVQPAFMFMAGSALYISYSRKREKGESWAHNFKHIFTRSLKLFICGVGLHCVYAGKPVWELWNVLTQLAFTTLIAYLIINKSGIWQVSFSFALLLLTELLYRYTHIPNFDSPFEEYRNFGAYMDTVLMGKINSDGWVAINIIPTAAHTIWGVLAGRLLIDQSRSGSTKIKTLVAYGLILLLVGYALDLSEITPIIKRISTSSFTLASGGWVIIILAAMYWLIDIRKQQRYVWILTVMGMNAIFIYLFFETVGMQWLNGIVNIFTGELLLLWFNIPVKIAALVSALAVWVLEWYLCYWLFKKKIFFKL
ncbi:acyltransferase family protein [Pseudopedobacter beijingensis]|uniref:Acyltransferase family protein n=1 Tax=Pseudopedobacter beijingensis TaxID=1207056 RepID=A0ABW4IBP4_9SPHI